MKLITSLLQKQERERERNALGGDVNYTGLVEANDQKIVDLQEERC